jgi:hypothetical protein
MNSAVAKRIRFADAVRLVGADDSDLLKLLDFLLGATLVAAAPATGGATIGWFDVKSDITRLLGELRLKIAPKLRGTAGRRRTELLAAAHAVLIVSAYFEAVDATGLLGEVTLHRDDELRLASAIRADPTGTDLVGGLLLADMPTPGPQRPYDVLAKDLHEHYRQMSERMVRFLTGLACWDEFDETARETVRRRLLTEVPDDALLRYEQNLGQFAAVCPEFVFWTNLWEHVATREALRRALPLSVYEQVESIAVVLRDMQGGLDGLAVLLRGLPAADAGALPRWRELAQVYDDDVRRPVTDAGEHGSPADLDMPSLVDSYINPAIRVAETGHGEVRPAEDAWWRAQASPTDIQSFFAGYLTSPAATERPLLVLGNPGSGKSVLTRVLAARLGTVGHRPVRIDLSRVPAGAPIAEQIEVGLRSVLARSVQWAELADTAGDLAPVVILDGLDELLQGIPTGRWDYLTQVGEFQRTQAARGRPVAVIVTSRTVVANRVRIPTGSAIIALEPFDESRIGAWLRRWNEHHASYFAARGLRALARGTVLRHVQLAEQPLLLLLLALYDLNDNALQTHARGLAHADLYERLLMSFVDREVRKSGAHPDEESIAARIDDELYRLAVAAYSMFNRASRYVTHEDLGKDLVALDLTQNATADGAAALVGHFYFIHVSRAVSDLLDDRGRLGSADRREWRTYEFLHATFAEYLVARLAVEALLGLPARGPGRRLTRYEPDDELLRTLLSWQPLTALGQVVAFVLHLARRDDVAGPAVREALLSIVRACLRQAEPQRLHLYQPMRRDAPARYATYSLNVIVLLVAVYGGRLPLADLWGDGDTLAQWRRLVLLWQASLDTDNWRSLQDELTVDGSSVVLRRSSDDARGAARRSDGVVVDLYRANGLLRDPALTGLLAAVRPLARLGNDVFQPSSASEGSPAGALLGLLCASGGDLAGCYASCLQAANDLPPEQRIGYLSLVVRRLGGVPVDAETVRAVFGVATALATATGDLLLWADIVECAAAHLGRDTTLDTFLLDLLATAGTRLASPSLALVEPAQRLRVAVVLAENGLSYPGKSRSPFTLAAALAEVDVVAVVHDDARLVTRILRAARLAGLWDWTATGAPLLVAALPAATLAKVSADELHRLAQSNDGSHLAS